MITKCQQHHQGIAFPEQDSSALLASIFDSPNNVIIFAWDKNYNYLGYNKAHVIEMKHLYNSDIENACHGLEKATHLTQQLLTGNFSVFHYWLLIACWATFTATPLLMGASMSHSTVSKALKQNKMFFRLLA